MNAQEHLRYRGKSLTTLQIAPPSNPLMPPRLFEPSCQLFTLNPSPKSHTRPSTPFLIANLI